MTTPEVKAPEGGVSVDLPSPPEVVVTEVPESEMMKLEGKLDDAPVLHVIEDKPQDLSLDVSGGDVDVDLPDKKLKSPKGKKFGMGFSFGGGKKDKKKSKGEPSDDEGDKSKDEAVTSDDEADHKGKKPKKSRSFNIKFPSFKREKKPKVEKRKDETEDEDEDKEKDKKKVDDKDRESKGLKLDLHMPKLPSFSLNKKKGSTSDDESDKKDNEDKIVAEVEKKIDAPDVPSLELEGPDAPVIKQTTITAVKTFRGDEEPTVEVTATQEMITPTVEVEKPDFDVSVEGDDAEKKKRGFGIDLPDISMPLFSFKRGQKSSDDEGEDKDKEKKEKPEKEADKEDDEEKKKRSGIDIHLPKLPSWSLKN